MNELKDLEMDREKPKLRLASLDFQRGVAIWMMTFLHAAANMYDSSFISENPGNILDLPISVILLIVFFGFFAVWNSYFLFISTTVNSLSMSKKILNGQDPKKILLRQILTGIGLLVVNIIDNSFLYSGYFGMSIRTGDWTNTYPLWRGFFEMGTLRIIAWSIIVCSILIYFLLKDKGYEKYRRNMIILGSLAVIIIIASQFVHNAVDNINWTIPSILPTGVDLGNNPSWPSVDFQALNASFKSWILTIFAGDIEPIFPYFATALVGAMIGMTLSKPEPIKKLPLIGGISGLGTMGLGGLFIGLGFVSFGNERPPLGNYFIMFGAQICSMFLLLWLVEYRGKAQQFGDNIIVKHFRKWGMISLSIYVLQIYELLPRFVVGSIYNLIFYPRINMVSGSAFKIGEEYKTLIFAIIAILFFELLIYLWSKVNFYLSFEWIITKSVSLVTKQTTYRLDVNAMMNKIQWIDYKTISQQNQISKETINTSNSV